MSKLIIKAAAIAAAAVLLCSPAAAEYNKTLTASAANTTRVSFPDINPDDWFAKDIKKLTETGVISGYPDGYFHPEREMTVAEFIKILGSTVPGIFLLYGGISYDILRAC